MRVICGSARGVKLKIPENENIRPTTEKVKEAIFDSLQFNIEDKRFLDLFSGSGQMGIEALSRGAKHVYFVDYFKTSIATLQYNLSRLNKNFKYNFSVIQKDALEFLQRNKDIFDIVFMDPPYAKNMIPKILVNLDKFINNNGIIICEHSKKDKLPTKIENLEIYKSKNYGTISVTFYKK